MGNLTPEDEAKIDLKLSKLKDELKKEISEDQKEILGDQKEYNAMIREMHQEVMGYGERKGMISNIIDHEGRLDDHEKRIKKVEDGTAGRIETRKAILGMIGSGGFVGLLIWLSQLFGGKTP